MPIFVNHDERREQIVTAALEVLGRQGLDRFTIRAVGERLGGSVTLVTHYFANRDALLDAVLERVLEEAREVQDELSTLTTPHERLDAAVSYFLPITEEAMTMERARVAVATKCATEPLVALNAELIDRCMRDVVRQGVADFVAPESLEATIDLIRIWTAGIVLTTVEHPETWTPERQSHAFDHFMRLIDLPVGVA